MFEERVLEICEQILNFPVPRVVASGLYSSSTSARIVYANVTFSCGTKMFKKFLIMTKEQTALVPSMNDVFSVSLSSDFLIDVERLWFHPQ